MAVNTERSHSAQQSSLFAFVLIRKILVLFFLMLMALLISIVIEWVGMAYWWEDEGVNHSRDMMFSEIGYLSMATNKNPLIDTPTKSIEAILELIDYWANKFGLSTAISSGYEIVRDGALAAVYITKVYILRVLVMALSTPTFIIFGLVGLVRGLVGRELRRWGGGRESSGMYHLYIKMLPETFIGLWFVYLSMPFTINPFVIVGPAAIMFAMLVANASYRLKKYI